MIETRDAGRGRVSGISAHTPVYIIASCCSFDHGKEHCGVCHNGLKNYILEEYRKKHCKNSGVPYGIRTRVAAVKGQCPRPLDERDKRRWTVSYCKMFPDTSVITGYESQRVYGPLPQRTQGVCNEGFLQFAAPDHPDRHTLYF